MILFFCFYVTLRWYKMLTSNLLSLNIKRILFLMFLLLVILSTSSFNGTLAETVNDQNKLPAYDITLSANPDDGGYTFTNWTENDQDISTDSDFTFSVSEGPHLTANFEVANESGEEDIDSDPKNFKIDLSTDPADIYEYPNFKDLTEKHGYPSVHVEWVFNDFESHYDSIKLCFSITY